VILIIIAEKPILVSGNQLQDNLFFSPSESVEAQQHCTAQRASWLAWVLHWLQDLSSAGKGCGVWLTE